MTKHKVSIPTFILILLSISIGGLIHEIHSQSNIQWITLYNEIADGGKTRTYELNTNVGEPDLDLHPNLRGVLDCQGRGIWIFYSGQNYTGSSYVLFAESSRWTIYSYSCNWMVMVFPVLGRTKSVRYAGVQMYLDLERSGPENIPSITLYDGINFNGKDLVRSAASSNVSFPFTSFISTSMQNIALYTGLGYTGSSVCIQPSKTVTQARNIATLGLVKGQVKSIKFSC